jgi:hypothetical protein
MRSNALSSSAAAGRNWTSVKLFSALFDQFSDEAGPARLVARADAGAVVAMEIFVEKEQVPPVRIFLENFRAAGDRTAAILSTHENVNETARDLSSDFPKI